MRFEAGLTGNTVKAARIESKASAGEAAWAVMRGWSYPTYMAPQLHTADVPAPLHAKERLRPPSLEGETFIGPVDPRTHALTVVTRSQLEPGHVRRASKRVPFKLNLWRPPYDRVFTGEQHVYVRSQPHLGDTLDLCSIQ